MGLRARLFGQRRSRRSRQRKLALEPLEPRVLLSAGFEFPNVLEVPLPSTPDQLFVADMDGNGLDDFVVSVTDGVLVLLADGQGGFGPPRPLMGAGLVAVADIGSPSGGDDGVQDIITTTGVIFGHTDGTYSIGPDHEKVRTLSGAAADFDRDGHVDFLGVRANDSSRRTYVYYGDGAGGFARGSLSLGEDRQFPVVGDLDHDSDPDIVLGHDGGGGNEVCVYLNLGTRQWSPQTAYELTSGYSDRPCLGDFDDDGHIDIAIGYFDDGQILFLEGRGDGTFEQPRAVAELEYIGPTAAADIDGDGVLDVVAAGRHDGKYLGPQPNLVTILSGDPTGVFSSQISVPVGCIPRDVVTGDFNSDGWTDIAVPSAGTNAICVVLNDGTGALGDSEVLGAGVIPYSGAVVGPGGQRVAADLDGDGYQDLVFLEPIGSFGRSNAYVAYGTSDGTFSDHVLLAADRRVVGVTLGYFDETSATAPDDRSLDIAFGDYWSGVFMNQGGRAWAYASGDFRDCLVSGDFNEDGCDDIVDCDSFGRGAGPRLHLGNGDGTFQSLGLGPPSAAALAAGHLDGDGHLDLVVIEERNDPGAWIGWGNGDGTFDFVRDERIRARTVWNPDSRNPSRVWIADCDGNGLGDIVEQKQVWLNAGSRMFHNALDIGGEPIDVNGDGIVDLVNTFNYGSLTVRFGDGHQGWTEPSPWACGTRPDANNVFYGTPADPLAYVLVGSWFVGSWAHPNPWRDVVAADTWGPRILEYTGPLNPGFAAAPTEFSFTVSESLDPTSVNAGSVRLLSAGADGLLGSSDDAPINGTLTYDSTARRISFQPAVPLAEGAYRFVVAGSGAPAVRDLAGNPLDGDVFAAVPSGNMSSGGDFTSTFYVVGSPPVPQALDSDENGSPDTATPVVLNGSGRATITGEIEGTGIFDMDRQDCYALGELAAGEVVMVDLDGSAAGWGLSGGAVSVYGRLPDDTWVLLGSSCLTDGFVDSHLTFPVRYGGEYVLEVSSYCGEASGRRYQESGTYAVDVAIEASGDPWWLAPDAQTVFLDFGGATGTPWGDIGAFDAAQVGMGTGQTASLIAAVGDAVQEDFAGLPGISIVTQEPTGDFSRVSIGTPPATFGRLDEVYGIAEKIDMGALDASDQALVSSPSFLGLGHYGTEAAAQAIANVVSHETGHLLGLQHVTSDPERLMAGFTESAALTQNASFGARPYWWTDDQSLLADTKQDAPPMLEYVLGPSPSEPGPVDFDMVVTAGGKLNVTGPAPCSVTLEVVGANGNPSSFLYALRIGDQQGTGWLRFDTAPSGRIDLRADGAGAEWHTADEWAGKRLVGLVPSTSYSLFTRAWSGAVARTPLVSAGTVTTNAAGDVNRSGLATALDLALIRVGQIRGGELGSDLSHALDTNGDGQLTSADTDIARSAVLHPTLLPPVPPAPSADDPAGMDRLRVAVAASYAAPATRASLLDRDGDGDVDRDDILPAVGG